MNHFVYIIAEGVLDVVFLTQVLEQGYQYSVIERKLDLPDPAARWLDQFNWPVGHDIVRRAVPAPAFLTKGGALVALRSARGLTGVRSTMRADDEAFFRLDWRPSTVAVILDADGATPSLRLAEFAALVAEHGYPRPSALDEVTHAAGLRAGVFAFPGGGQPGTVEDVLLPLASVRFPALEPHSATYVAEWQANGDAQTADDFSELRAPSGPKKARLSAAAALLKPGKSLNASIEDQGWIPADPRSNEALKPLMGFLDQLLAPVPSGTAP